MVLVGDLALGLGVGWNLEAQRRGDPTVARLPASYPFSGVGERLRQADLVVGNLECVLSRRGSRETDHMPIRCPEAALTPLRQANVSLLSVANNHAMDFGQEGFEDMLEILDGHGLGHFGSEIFRHRPQGPTIRTLGDTRVGLLAHYDTPPQRLHQDVRRARPQVDVLVVFCHWGQEDWPEPLEYQRRIARELIDDGADLVVGAHAHVRQPTEWVGGRLVAYGLGNFVFSGMADTEAHRRGALLEVSLASKRIVGHRLVETRLDDDGAPHVVGERELRPDGPRSSPQPSDAGGIGEPAARRGAAMLRSNDRAGGRAEPRRRANHE